jgi:hypothetical protein
MSALISRDEWLGGRISRSEAIRGTPSSVSDSHGQAVRHGV